MTSIEELARRFGLPIDRKPTDAEFARARIAIGQAALS